VAVLKVIELVGVSGEGWGAAARAAVAQASRTIRHVEALEVLKSTAIVREGAIVEYRAQVKLTFRVEDDAEQLLAVEAVEELLAEPQAENGGEPATTLLERQSLR
jgi:flavin-binding protein dodecin